MAVLSDRCIENALDNEALSFDPPLNVSLQVQPASIDLRLGVHFIFERRLLWHVWQVEHRLAPGDWVSVPPHSFVLATTMEYVVMPPHLLGRVDGRSSIGRLGVFIENAGFIDPGFAGQITLELYNASAFARRFQVGQRICQMSLERLSSPCRRPYGHPDRHSKYQGQRGATLSRLQSEVREPDGWDDLLAAAREREGR